jgi:hypothetical protein
MALTIKECDQLARLSPQDHGEVVACLGVESMLANRERLKKDSGLHSCRPLFVVWELFGS